MKYCKHSVLVTTTKPRKDGGMSIVYRVSYQGRQDSLYSGISIKKDQWSTKTQQVKRGYVVKGTPYNIINETLLTHRTFIENYFNSCALRDCDASLSELKDKFNHEFKMTGAVYANEF